MAVHTFSTKDKKNPDDENMMLEIKQHCEQKGLVFSSLVLSLLRQWKKENIDDRRTKA